MARSAGFEVDAELGETIAWFRTRLAPPGARLVQASDASLEVSTCAPHARWPAEIRLEFAPAAQGRTYVRVEVQTLSAKHSSKIDEIVLELIAPLGEHASKPEYLEGRPLAVSQREAAPIDKVDSKAHWTVRLGQSRRRESDASIDPAPVGDSARSTEHRELSRGEQLERLGPISWKMAATHISPDDKIVDIIKGSSGQCIVALEDRLVIVKPPGVLAGLRSQTTVLPYGSITALEVNMGVITGSIEVIAAGYDGKHKTNNWTLSGAASNDRNPARISNVIPIDRRGLKLEEHAIRRIRRRIAQAQARVDTTAWASPTVVSGTNPQTTLSSPTIGISASAGIADELTKLAELRERGELTAEEFSSLKARLLG